VRFFYSELGSSNPKAGVLDRSVGVDEPYFRVVL